MKTSLQRIITKDNLELVGLLYEPDQGSKKMLVHVHGMAGNFYENKFLDFMAKTLTDGEVSLFVFNNRGCEYIKDLTRVVDGKRQNVRIGDTYEKFEDCIFDIQAAVDFVDEKGFSEIHLSGHSLAGPKAAYYLSETNDARVKSVIFMSPADMVGLAKADKNYEKDLEIATLMIVEGRGEELMPHIIWGEAYLTANAFVSLNTAGSKVAIFNFHDPNDRLEVLGKITIPALTIMGRKDTALTIPVEQTMERITAAMTASRAETNILGDADHGYTDHGQPLADTILAWIRK